MKFQRIHATYLMLALSVLILANLAGTARAQGDWFDRMSVPLVQGTDFVSMRDASLKAVGLYAPAELMLGPWYVLGPYPREGSSSAPLQNIDITAKIKTNAGVGGWTAVKGWGDTSQPLDLAALMPGKENVSAYLYRSFQAPGPASIEIRASADDDFTVWLNGNEIISRTTDSVNAAYGKNRKRVNLRKGENELIIRVGQAAGPWRLFFGWEPQIDARIKAKILSESLRAFPNSPDSSAGRVELAQLFLDLNDRDRAIEQASLVLADSAASPDVHSRADSLIRRFLDLSVTTKQTWNLFAPDDLLSQTLPVLVTLANRTATTATGQIAVAVNDVSGQAIGPIPAIPYTLPPQKSLSQTISFRPPSWGPYLVMAQTPFGKVSVRDEAIVGFIPKARAGLRPDSFFAVTTDGQPPIAACAKMGVKVVRDIFCNYKWALKQLPETTTSPAALELDFSRLDKAVGDLKQAGISVLAIAGDARPLASVLARKLGASGPPDNMTSFTNVSLSLAKHFPEIKYWDFWGDTEIYGPTWTAAAANFRYSLKQWAQSLKQARPDLKILAGGRPSFFNDVILHDPNVVKVMDGISNCTRFDSQAANWRSGAQLRSMDFGAQAARNESIPLALVTDSSIERSLGQIGLTPDRRLDAAKLLKLHVLAALSGNFMANVHQHAGWGSEFPLGNVAYGVMTEMLEDRPVAADIWPAHPLVWGAVFAHPKWITDEVKALPRAKDISARWGVAIPKDRENDASKVAVVWAETGLDAEHLDSSGTLTLQPAGDFRALDMFGRPAGRNNGDALVVPLNQYPIYLLSEQLGVAAMQKQIAGGRIEALSPVSSYFYSLPGPLGGAPTTLTARVQNQLNRPLKGTFAVSGPKEWKIEPAQQSIELKPAEIVEVSFRVSSTSFSAINQYPVQAKVESDGGKYERREVVGVACVRPITAKVDGRLDEWTTATFARVDSQQQLEPERYWKWLADQTLPFPEPPPGRAYLGTKMAVGYDAASVYVAAVVREPGLGNSASGAPATKDQNPMTNGDCLEIAFGFRDRADDGVTTATLRKPDDPWYWKGMFRDTDFVMLTSRNTGDQTYLLTLCVPGLVWRTDFQTENSNTWPILGGQSRFVRDETARTTTWELAIPRKYLNRFDPSKPYVRLGFIYYNDEKLPPLEWSRVSGVFDYWTNFGSFLPAWNPLLPCQTRWGIGR